jgi:surface protein
MDLKSFFTMILMMALVWSCGKNDDSGAPEEENTPPMVNAKIFSVSEAIGPEYAIGIVDASDDDGDDLVFSTAHELFEIGNVSGVLRLRNGKSLDFDLKNQHILEVNVSDGKATSSANMTINVMEVGGTNQPPTITAQVFEVSEDITDTDEIGTVTALDEEGDDLEFFITEDLLGLFGITPEGGLTLLQDKKLDYDLATEHVITVSVFDGNSMASAIITIKVTQGNQPPVAEAQIFEASEDITDANEIGVVTALDEEGDDLEFSIVEDESGQFVISTSGELHLAEGQQLDYETATEHTITVGVDDGIHTIQVDVTVNVLNVIESMQEEDTSFVTTWKTMNNAETISIGTNAAYTYNYTIDWGDGTAVEHITSSEDAEHIYATAGTYTVAIQGEFPKISMSLNSSAPKLMSIEQWGSIVWKSFSHSFSGCTFMMYNAKDDPILSNVTSMTSMFRDASSFTGENFEDWDVSTIESMDLMFAGAANFNGDISGWNVTVVEFISSMFEDATYFNRDLNGWDVSNVTNMNRVFRGATSFNGKIDEWDVSNVDDMENMFQGATSFNQSLKGWDVSGVYLMGHMFENATAFNGDVSDWKPIQAADMGDMFHGASSFNGDVSGWETPKVENMGDMFHGASSFNGDVSGWETPKVENMVGMFEGASSFNSPMGEWDVSNVSDMRRMFEGATSFDQDLTGWDVGKVNNMGRMFKGATSFNGDVSGWNLTEFGLEVQMYRMFEGATSFDQDLGGWNIEKVSTMNYIFDNSGMSKENYSDTLVGWSTQNNAFGGNNIGALNIAYCNTAAVMTARTTLESNGWEIVGDTPVNCN